MVATSKLINDSRSSSSFFSSFSPFSCSWSLSLALALLCMHEFYGSERVHVVSELRVVLRLLWFLVRWVVPTVPARCERERLASPTLFFLICFNYNFYFYSLFLRGLMAYLNPQSLIINSRFSSAQQNPSHHFVLHLSTQHSHLL